MLLHLTLLFAAFASDVVLTGEEYAALRPPDPEKPETAPGPMVTERLVQVQEVEGSIVVDAVWQVRTKRPGWLELPLPDPSFWAEFATWNGRPLAVRGMRDGSRRLLVRVDGDGELVLRGELPGELRRGVRLVLPPAAVGRVIVKTDDPEIEVTGGGIPAIEARGGLWTGAEELTISTQKQVEARERTRIVVASSGLGVTIQDGALAVHGRLRWVVRRGELDTVRFQAPGAGADLVVQGPAVARWTRQGDEVTVQLEGMQDSFVELEARWTQSLPDIDEAQVPLPALTPLDVFRTEFAVQIARDGDRDVVPGFRSWTAIPHRALPEVATGLVEGTPVSSWTASSSSGAAANPPTLGLFRFQPVSGPPTIIDVAAYDGAYNTDGRLLLRGHYAVRNDRGAFLEVTLPPGTRLIAARVEGQPARVARKDGKLLIPLAKSVETVQGLLSFPITLVMLQDSTPFAKKDLRDLALPSLSAEVASTHATIHLPPGWENRIEPGEDGTVEAFSEGAGLTYGLAAGDGKVAIADRLYQEALGSWMNNEFEEAQEKLDNLRGLGADNENVVRLQSNLDVVLRDEGGSEGSDDNAALANRVKDQARARSFNQEAQQQRLLKEAEVAYASGDYDQAEEAWGSAVEIGQTLEKLETGGSVEASSGNAVIFKKLELAQKQKAKAKPMKAPEDSRSASDAPAGIEDGEERGSVLTPEFVESLPSLSMRTQTSMAAGVQVGAPPEAAPAVEYSEQTVIDFKGEEVVGELAKPQGVLVLTASTVDVVIPASGEAVRYQRLLTRVDEQVALSIRAKRGRR